MKLSSKGKIHFGIQWIVRVIIFIIANSVVAPWQIISVWHFVVGVQPIIYSLGRLQILYVSHYGNWNIVPGMRNLDTRVNSRFSCSWVSIEHRILFYSLHRTDNPISIKLSTVERSSAVHCWAIKQMKHLAYLIYQWLNGISFVDHTLLRQPHSRKFLKTLAHRCNYKISSIQALLWY